MITTRRASLRVLLAGMTIFAVGGTALAGKRNLGIDGLTIEGYDPVAYFTEDEAVAGSPKITAVHDGATYRFSSAQNRAAFLADPAKYLPQYGGFCAFAVSRGATAAVDPQAFTVVDGKLYLNFTKRVRGIWQTDIPGNISKADTNWPKLSGE